MPLVLDHNGLEIQTLGEIKSEIEDDFRELEGPDFNLDPEDPPGQLVGIMSEREASVQAALAQVYGAWNKRAATGDALVALAALTNTEKAGPAPSVVPQLRLVGVPGTAVEGRIVRHVATDSLWSVADATIGVGGDVVTSATAQVDGPTYATATAEAGAWEIVTPVAGWTAAESLVDAVPGRFEESDEELRARMDAEASTRGGSTIPSGRANIQQDVEGVSRVIAINNPGLVWRDDVPPGAVEYVVTGGLDADVAAAIWQSAIAGGIEPWGATSVVIADDDGISRTVRFSRPTPVPVWVRITVSTGGAEIPIDTGAPAARAATIAAIQQAVVTYGATVFGSKASLNVVPIYFVGAVLSAIPQLSARGVLVEVSFDGAVWSSQPLDIATREEPQFAIARAPVTVL